jgi:hypothetical protein
MALRVQQRATRDPSIRQEKERVPIHSVSRPERTGAGARRQGLYETHENCPRHGDRRGGMKSGLSMTSRAEVTTRFAKAYGKASKKDRGLILDQVVEV